MFRNFTFTWNNYPDDCEDKLRALKGVKYAIYGRETASTGTPHLQGTICFKNANTHDQVVKKLPGCHVEVCAALHKSIEYCQKDGDYVEWGTAPKTNKQKGELEKNRWKRIREACEDDRMDDVDDEVRFRMYKACEHFRAQGAKRRKLPDTEATHQWYHGTTGTGKSRKARTENPDAFIKMCNKWWDGYDDQEVVIIEDFDKKHDVLCHHMKIWGDRYCFPAEHKGGAKMIRPKKIIVTSNYHPDEIWFQDADLQPILRRFKPTRFGPDLYDKT